MRSPAVLAAVLVAALFTSCTRGSGAGDAPQAPGSLPSPAGIRASPPGPGQPAPPAPGIQPPSGTPGPPGSPGPGTAPRQPGAPTPGPSGAPPVSDRPFRVSRMAELWAFTAERTTYSVHGELVMTRATRPFGFVAVAAPMQKGHGPKALRVSPTVRLTSLQPATNPQGYPAFSPVLELVAPQPAGATVPFELSAEFDEVPYVHGTGMTGRLLSLTFGNQADAPTRRYIFAIPDTTRFHSFTDAQPTSTREIPGWKIYEYQPSPGGRPTVVHISFDYGAATQPPPTLAVRPAAPR